MSGSLILVSEEFRIQRAELLKDYLERAIKLIRVKTEYSAVEKLGDSSFGTTTLRPFIPNIIKTNGRQNVWFSLSLSATVILI